MAEPSIVNDEGVAALLYDDDHLRRNERLGRAGRLLKLLESVNIEPKEEKQDEAKQV